MESKEILKEYIKGRDDFIANSYVIKLFMREDPAIYSWIYEASKQEILNDILNETFSHKDSKIIDWAYVLIQEKKSDNATILNVYSIDEKNAFSFDLNLLFRRDFKYMYKIYVLRDI